MGMGWGLMPTPGQVPHLLTKHNEVRSISNLAGRRVAAQETPLIDFILHRKKSLLALTLCLLTTLTGVSADPHPEGCLEAPPRPAAR